MKILTVCLGNICRSPLAEGLLQRAIERRGLDWTVDSAGTGAYHVGDPPDPRSIAVAKAHDLDIHQQRARRIRTTDLATYDLILAMDRSNYRNILSLTDNPEERAKVQLFLPYANPNASITEVPDPYWDDEGFEQVYQLLEHAADQLLDRLLQNPS